MKNLAYWFYQPYKWIIVIPLFGIETVLCTLLILITAPFRTKIDGKIGEMWANILRFIVPMRVEVTGKENIAKGESYIFAANHQSAFDIILIYGCLPAYFKWIMKEELRHAPVLGKACEKMNHIFIDRSSARASYRSIQKAKEILTCGTSVVIFPEGTRSRSGKLLPFKSGAFKMAESLDLPIIPVTIDGTRNIMGPSISTLMPGKVRLVIHKPIDVKSYAERHAELVEATRNAIESGFNK